MDEGSASKGKTNRSDYLTSSKSITNILVPVITKKQTKE